MPRLALKIDVDTDRGTRDGIVPLAAICQRHRIPALFLFSLGPDNMGKSIFRIFEPGFFRKVMRSKVASNYGLRTLLNGTLLPAPHLGRKYGDLMRQIHDMGFDVGVHCYDHYLWQNRLNRLSLAQTREQFHKAADEFQRIFQRPPDIAGAPGWQCNRNSLAVYDEAHLLFGSDTRGDAPFMPRMSGQVFLTPQFPTTLPTLDEVLGRPEYPLERLADFYLGAVKAPGDHVLTAHAELEGINYSAFFESFVQKANESGVEFYSLRKQAEIIKQRGLEQLPIGTVEMETIPGRSGAIAVGKVQ